MRITKYIEKRLDFDALDNTDRADMSVSPEGEAVIEVLTKDGEPECVRYSCPCGCGQRLMLWLSNSSRHRAGFPGPLWDFRRHDGYLLHPSVRHGAGCRSHYHIKADGTVAWSS